MGRTLAAAVALSLAGAAYADFSGVYAPENWTFEVIWEGSVDTSGAPASIEITGGDNGSGYTDVASFTIAAAADGTFSFDWAYSSIDDPGWDWVGYYIGDTMYNLSDIPGTFGSVSEEVLAGDKIGWFVVSVDSMNGAGVAEISNFTGPIPAPGTLALLGAAALAVRGRRRA
ncbi:MAG: hypothetical protein KAS72_10175 [Phycisphaerales bacterium]|nr:hypothetical protein [Phycisphaerales bacterium]